MKQQPWEWAARQQRAAQEAFINRAQTNTGAQDDSAKAYRSNKTIFDCPCGARVAIRERDVFLCPKCDRLWVLKADEPGRRGYKEAVNVGAK